MEDFIELGIEGADKMVDKHFHKLPDKAFQQETYDPRELRKKRHRRRHHQTPSSSESDFKSRQMSQDPHQNSVGTGVPPQYATPPHSTYVPHSQKPPNFRPEYASSPPPIGQPYFSPPRTQSVDRSRGRRYEDDDSDEDRYARPRRPAAVTRRSSSYHGPRGSDDYHNERQSQTRRRGSHDESQMARSRDGGNHNFKDEPGKFLTKSQVGITGAVGGALVGGWAAKTAQDALGRNRGRHPGSNSLLTLLGAAAGGLVANVAVDRHDKKKRETEEKGEKWEEKFGNDDERDDRRRRGDGGRTRKRRSRSYSNDRYD